MRFVGLTLFSSLLLCSFSLQAADEVAQTVKAVEKNSVFATKFAPMSNPFFARPIELRGKLGDDKVVMHLQPKTEDMDSVEGSYQLPGSKRNKGNKILLAGEVGGNKLSMEESEDGVDVSGQWDGELSGKTIRGVWQSDDGKATKDFVLELLEKKSAQKLSKQIK